MVQEHIHQAVNNYSAVRASYAAGTKDVPKDITLRVLASRLEEGDGKSIRARTFLEKVCLVKALLAHAHCKNDQHPTYSGRRSMIDCLYFIFLLRSVTSTYHTILSLAPSFGS
jgi:hypothetical protein